MKKIFLFCAVMISSIIALAQPTNGSFPQNDVNDDRHTVYAFTNATIHVDANTRLENATLIIKDDKIEAVGISVAVPANAVVMDLKGNHIYPSMIDIYSDYGMPEIPKSSGEWNSSPQYLNDKKGAYGWNEAIKSEQNANELFTYNKDKADAMRQLGFGMANVFMRDGIARGSSAFVSLNDEMVQKLFAQDKSAAMYSFDKGSSSQGYPSSLMGSIALIRQTYLDAQWYEKAKYIAEYNISLDAWNNLKSLPAIFEVSDKLNVLRADKIGDEFGMQYIIKTKGDAYQRIDEIKATSAPLIISVDFPKPYDVENPFDAALVSLADMLHWEMAPLNPSALEKAGIKFALTPFDLKEKKDFWKNLRNAIDFGLTKNTALASLTSVPAELLGVSDQVGTLSNGKLANFIITSTDLFDEKNIIYQNWIQGKQFVITDFDFKDIRGKYDFTVNKMGPLVMRVEGDIQSPEIKFGVADSSAIKVTFSKKDDLVTLTYKPDKDAEGVIRLSGNIDGNVWKGQGQLIDGSWINWTATFKEAYVEKKEEEKKEIELPEGKIRYPFVSYGWTEQPKAETVLLENATV